MLNRKDHHLPEVLLFDELSREFQDCRIAEEESIVTLTSCDIGYHKRATKCTDTKAWQ